MRIVHFSYFQVAYMLYWWVDFGNENLASLERERERDALNMGFVEKVTFKNARAMFSS